MPTVKVRIAVAVALALLGCKGTSWETPAQRRETEWSGPCHDESRLVATTAGSPNGFECPNAKHRMRVEVKTQSGEEIAALVVCECIRDAEVSAVEKEE